MENYTTKPFTKVSEISLQIFRFVFIKMRKVKKFLYMEHRRVHRFYYYYNKKNGIIRWALIGQSTKKYLRKVGKKNFIVELSGIYKLAEIKLKRKNCKNEGKKSCKWSTGTGQLMVHYYTTPHFQIANRKTLIKITKATHKNLATSFLFQRLVILIQRGNVASK